MSAIAVIREGSGPELLLVHGGASPTTTWAGLEHLSERWTLAYVYRRGYPPNPEPRERQDFEIDADDVEPLLQSRPHVIAHSYGALGALIAATRRPAQIRSLSLLEPALYLIADDPDVAHLKRLGDEVLMNGLETDPATLREFLRLAGAQVDDGPLPEELARGVRRAHGGRLPGEANPALGVLRDRRIPTLVASGGHARGLELICDALAMELNARRVIAPGAGHFVARAAGFAAQLEEFLISAS